MKNDVVMVYETLHRRRAMTETGSPCIGPILFKGEFDLLKQDVSKKAGVEFRLFNADF